MYSTTPLRYSYRDPKQGSWFETKMKEVIDKKATGSKVSLLDFFTNVCGKVSKEESKLDKTNENTEDVGGRSTKKLKRETQSAETSRNAGGSPVPPGSKCVPCLEHRLTSDIELSVI